MTYRLKHTSYFTVSALRNGHPVPAIRAFATALFNRAKLGHAVVELDTIGQSLLFLPAQGSQNSNGVLPLQSKARVHQMICQLPRTAEQEQSLGVEVKPADRLPFALKQLGQTAKHSGPVLRIVVGNHLTSGLVVSDDPGRWRINPDANRLAIDLDMVSKLNPLANVCGLIVDRDAPLHDELLHLQSRTHAVLGQHLVQLGIFGLWGQDPPGRLQVWLCFICIEQTRHHVIESTALRAGLHGRWVCRLLGLQDWRCRLRGRQAAHISHIGGVLSHCGLPVKSNKSAAAGAP